MERKKLSLNKITLSHLSEAEKKNVVGGAVSDVYVNTKCASPITYVSSSYLATCPLTETPKATCNSQSLAYKSCA